MTVAEIKEYIQKQIEKYDEISDEYQDAKFKQATADLVIVLGMLDELEQEKNMYNELENKLVRGESIPLMANEEFIEMLEKDTELKENNK